MTKPRPGILLTGALVGACLPTFVGCYSGRSASSGAHTAGYGDGADSAGGNSGGGDSGDAEADPVDPETADRVGLSGLRRLTAAEYNATVRDLLGVDIDSQLFLPTDWREPFDNDYTKQYPSQALIEGAELVAADVAEAALAAPNAEQNLIGCTPSSPTDEDCFRHFIARFGRKALRRPLTDAEVDRYAALISESQESGDFNAGVEVVVRAFLQHIEFLYRVEIGRPVQGETDLFELNDYEVATRLSYFLWGSTPSDDLLDLAEAGELGTAEGIQNAAQILLADERARARVERFHSLWLGYERLPHEPELSDAMHAESRALINRVIFEDDLPWQELLRSNSTYITPQLAEHYGMPAPSGDAGWVDYTDSGRRGLLSHGSFLSAADKIDDSSPTKRGALIRARLMCEVIPPPPPDVNVDDAEPAEGTCKEDFYRTNHAQGTCAGCHAKMDPIGLGLERYDHRGQYRTNEIENPDCTISGQGDLDGKPFSGPAELSNLLVESGSINRCVAKHLYRLSIGRSELNPEDEAFIDIVLDQVGSAADFHFADMIVAFVGDDAFRYRRPDPKLSTIDPSDEGDK